MTDRGNPTAEIRTLAAGDLPEADRIFRTAFGTFLGLPEPASFAGDGDVVATRWRADPSTTFAAVRDGELAGSNLVWLWGSIGGFGPLSVRPDLWEQGVAKTLLEPTVALLDERGVDLGALFTFAHSPKHVGLYQHFGYWPQHLTAILARQVRGGGAPGWSVLSGTPDPEAVVRACGEVTGAIYDGFDVEREIRAVADQGLGDTVVVEGDAGVEAFAVCHVGAGTEAGSGNCYVKVGAARPGAAAARNFGRLLDACDGFASQQQAATLTVGANTARHEAYRELRRRGFMAMFQGVVMTRPNRAGYNRPGVYILDDWR